MNVGLERTVGRSGGGNGTVGPAFERGTEEDDGDGRDSACAVGAGVGSRSVRPVSASPLRRAGLDGSCRAGGKTASDSFLIGSPSPPPVLPSACTECGFEVGDAKFCPKCGTAAPPPPQPPYCYQCGSVPPAGAVYCDSCGSRLDVSPGALRPSRS